MLAVTSRSITCPSPNAEEQGEGRQAGNRKRGKNDADDEKRELIFKEDEQEYAQVIRVLGNGRDYQDDKVDVILKHMPDEAMLLKAYGELPEKIKLNDPVSGGTYGGGNEELDDNIDFQDEDCVSNLTRYATDELND
ncbi:hypothetical protein Peur_059598 [Populus x canadensis]